MIFINVSIEFIICWVLSFLIAGIYSKDKIISLVELINSKFCSIYLIL